MGHTKYFATLLHNQRVFVNKALLVL